MTNAASVVCVAAEQAFGVTNYFVCGPVSLPSVAIHSGVRCERACK
jgi:hypothetical protein